MTQISVSNVGVEFGANRIFEKITFTIGEGDRWAILGRNGSGKTTLFRLITGTQQPTEGTVTRHPGLKMALLEQHRDFGDAQTVWEAGAGEYAALLALAAHLRSGNDDTDLNAPAWTLQTGRQEMAHRLAVVAADPADLVPRWETE